MFSLLLQVLGKLPNDLDAFHQYVEFLMEEIVQKLRKKTSWDAVASAQGEAMENVARCREYSLGVQIYQLWLARKIVSLFDFTVASARRIRRAHCHQGLV